MDDKGVVDGVEFDEIVGELVETCELHGHQLDRVFLVSLEGEFLQQRQRMSTTIKETGRTKNEEKKGRRRKTNASVETPDDEIAIQELLADLSNDVSFFRVRNPFPVALRWF